MARFLVTYTDGDTETITAERIDSSGSQYIGWVGDGSVAAYTPATNVRSIVRQDDEAVTG
jgi:hypothetical protein